MKTYSLYAAGKIEKNDWRCEAQHFDAAFFDETEYEHHSVDDAFRSSVTDITPYEALELDPGDPSRIAKYRLLYVGPYFISTDHGDCHGPGQHGASGQWHTTMPTPVRSKIPRYCCEQIRRCDIFYARLGEASDAYGTLVEIGFAHALGKPIYLDVDIPLVPSDEELQPVILEMWFALQLSLDSPLLEEHLEVIPYWVHQPLTLAAYREGLEQLVVAAGPSDDGPEYIDMSDIYDDGHLSTSDLIEEMHRDWEHREKEQPPADELEMRLRSKQFLSE